MASAKASPARTKPRTGLCVSLGEREGALFMFSILRRFAHCESFGNRRQAMFMGMDLWTGGREMVAALER